MENTAYTSFVEILAELLLQFHLSTLESNSVAYVIGLLRQEEDEAADRALVSRLLGTRDFVRVA